MRVHFWAALIATPFLLAAALTGLIYVFSPQIETQMHGRLDHVEVATKAQPIDNLVDIAIRAAGEKWSLHSIVPMHFPTDSFRAVFIPSVAIKHNEKSEHASHEQIINPSVIEKPKFLRPNFGIPNNSMVVYINPYNSEVLGSLLQSDRFSIWSKNLHSKYLQNDQWRWLIELAASWLMVMLLTGIYLWWPRTTQPFLPQAKAEGRSAWMQWHTFVGITLSLMSAAIVTTGLTWSKQSGNQIRWVLNATGQTSPRIPAHFKSTASEGAKVLTWEQAVQAVRREAPDVQMMLMHPNDSEGFWRANQIESDKPTRNFDLLLDAYSGERLFFSGWSEQTTFGKATAIGIPFHRGEFGWWNQVLLFVFGLGVMFSIVSGWMMYFKRRKQGLRGIPSVMKGAWKSVPWWAWLGAVLMLIAMPLLAMSATLVVLFKGGLAMRKTFTSNH